MRAMSWIETNNNNINGMSEESFQVWLARERSKTSVKLIETQEQFTSTIHTIIKTGTILSKIIFTWWIFVWLFCWMTKEAIKNG